MTDHIAETTWYLAQLKPNSARIAEKHLKRQGFQAFLPMEEETRQRGGRFVTTERPLFPGYIFVAFDVSKDQWRAVKSTTGITRLVTFGQEPAPVPADLVEQLSLRCEASGKLLPPVRLQPGDWVRVTKGPFTEIVAEIEHTAPERRVWVLLDIMGGRARVSVGMDQVRVV